MGHHGVAKGRPVAILGGGPSLPEHLEIIRRDYPDAVLIGINHHASKIVDCDYIFFNDKHTGPFVKDLPGLKIGSFPEWCDIVRQTTPGSLSSCRAVKIAREMGGKPILLAGMDCGGSYFHGEYYNKRGDNLKMHLQWWLGVDRTDVIPLGGPLVEYFKGLDNPPKPPTERLEITKELNVPTSNGGAIFFKPGVQDLPPYKAAAARAAGIVKEN